MDRNQSQDSVSVISLLKANMGIEPGYILTPPLLFSFTLLKQSSPVKNEQTKNNIGGLHQVYSDTLFVCKYFFLYIIVRLGGHE